MKLLDDCAAYLVGFFDALTLWGGSTRDLSQHPLDGRPGYSFPRYPHFPANGQLVGYPDFDAPNGPQEGVFTCSYPAMEGWTQCSTPENRGCWLRAPNGTEYNITTNYEDIWPTGIQRNYTLDVSDIALTLDGLVNPAAQVFNGSYPGPWLQACWGDDIEVTVTNNLRYNGTTIHWHGIRQLGTAEADGVNAVTQCPIAPGDSYTYRFKALQYGTSWYHSHYSLQYSNGILGPLTIYGPSSANYDEAINPTLMSDWIHESAFEAFHLELVGPPPNVESVLLNGIGDFAGASATPNRYEVSFTRGKKYLMRLINTSTDTDFIFAIDNHNITVMSSDFVPIVPYNTTSVRVAIGQRYHVVVNAAPINSNATDFWIRTIPATGCSTFATGNTPDERQGILRYGETKNAIPTTVRGFTNITCGDEPYDSLVPVVPWTVGPPSNNRTADSFEVGLSIPTATGPPLPHGNFSRWSIGNLPMFLNFSEPTILDLDNTTFNPEVVVIPEDLPADSWIYFLISGVDIPENVKNPRFIPVAHPIHLHGHDFALLAQSSAPFNASQPLNLKLDNPPRRDVVLLPQSGYIVIAFRADNPGSWLLHCHIAWHASSGLSLQVLERQRDAQQLYQGAKMAETQRTCQNWDSWFSDPSNFFDPAAGVLGFQDDSGI